MWPFSNKKTLIKQGIFNGFTDNHSHILPGVDDGVEKMEESLRILAEYEQMGISEVWLTPHVQEYLPNTTAKLQSRYQELLQSYQGGLTLHLAAEYMLDPLFVERLAQDDLLLHSLPGESPMILVETSYFNPPMNFWGLLKSIKEKGITPILAHPERYQYMKDADYDRLHEEGIIMQTNLPSLLDYYGKGPRVKARALLEKGYISLFGTDIHSERMLPVLKEEKTEMVKL